MDDTIVDEAEIETAARAFLAKAKATAVTVEVGGRLRGRVFLVESTRTGIDELHGESLSRYRKTNDANDRIGPRAKGQRP